MPSLHKFFISRYYLHTTCILCGDTIVHNQYNNNKLFNRIAHLECVKGKNKGRMNNHILIRDTQRINNGKRITTWREI